MAAAPVLSVLPDQSLSLVTEAVTVSVSGQASQDLNGTALVLTVKGPFAIGDVGNEAAEAGVAARFPLLLGGAPGAVGAVGVPAQLASGALSATVVLPAGTPSAPGAYLLVAEVWSGQTLLAAGNAWLGKAAVRGTPLDVSFVLPISLGVHRNVDGSFIDRVLEAAVSPVEAGNETIRSLRPLVERFPEWNLTIAPEPLLLAQLRDMSDGYLFSSTDEKAEVGANDLAPQNAAAVLDDLRALAARESIEIAASPYAGADLGLLASEGWMDGFEQIQTGKQELQQTLGLGAPVSGAYSPDLGLTSGSLASYASASIDRVVVTADLQTSLTEAAPPGAVAVRARNAEGDRVTLVLADSTVSSAVVPPWDADLLGAAIAAALASGPRDALVIAPRDVFELIPAAYLERVAAILTGSTWMRTQTLEQIVETHSLGNRPVIFQTMPARPGGYIEGVLQAGVRRAHSAVDDLAAAADTTRTPVDLALRLLYTAESRWWSRAGTSPGEASMGLAYAAEAEAVAQGELGKVRVAKVDSPLISGEEGTLRVVVENSADYPLAVELRLEGEDLTFSGGDSLPLELPPGRTVLNLAVASESGPHRVVASLVIGERLLDEYSSPVRFLRLTAVLPWLIVVAVLLVMGGVYAVVRRRLRKKAEVAEG